MQAKNRKIKEVVHFSKDHLKMTRYLSSIFKPQPNIKSRAFYFKFGKEKYF